jgi:hypothetical protein
LPSAAERDRLAHAEDRRRGGGAAATAAGVGGGVSALAAAREKGVAPEQLRAIATAAAMATLKSDDAKGTSPAEERILRCRVGRAELCVLIVLIRLSLSLLLYRCACRRLVRLSLYLSRVLLASYTRDARRCRCCCTDTLVAGSYVCRSLPLRLLLSLLLH